MDASSTGTGPLVLTGAVVRATGTYVNNQLDVGGLTGVRQVAGARVELAWFPNGRGAGIGQPLILVGAATTDTNGRYAISAAPTADMVTEAAGNDGWVNFLVAVSSGDGYVLQGVSRHWNGAAWTSYGGDRPGMSADEITQTVFATDAGTGRTQYGTIGSSTTDRATISVIGCKFFPQSYFYAYTNIVEFHNSPDSDGTWQYGATADSDIQIGISYTGSSWSTSGSAHIGNSLGGTIGGTTSALWGKYIATMFRYEQGFLGQTPEGSCAFTNFGYVRAVSWASGVMYTADVSQFDCLDLPQYNYRVTYAKGTYYYKSTARAAGFSFGAGLGFVILGATSGYSDKVDMQWIWSRNWGYICGNNNMPPQAGILYAW